jgi:hypothetical protein
LSKRVRTESTLVDEGADAVAGADEEELAVMALRADVVVHDDAESGRVHVGDLGEVEDEAGGTLGTELGLKVEDVAEGQRTVQGEDRDAFPGAVRGGVGERLIGHRVQYRERVVTAV